MSDATTVPARHSISEDGTPAPLPDRAPLHAVHDQMGSPVSPVAEARDVVKIYGSAENQVTALDHVNVTITRGTFTAILGPSGSGKSTLMHCLAGLDRVTSGHVLIDGQDLTQLGDRALTQVRRDHVGFVFQSFNLLPTLTAAQNIVLPLDLAGKKPDPHLYTQLTTSLGLTERLTHRPSELSGGQQQRVAVARALITQPAVVFADEPTGALDSHTSTQLLDYLRTSVKTLGQTIIMVTHDPKAAAYADRALILLDGTIVDDLTNPDVDAVNNALKKLEA